MGDCSELNHPWELRNSVAYTNESGDIVRTVQVKDDHNKLQANGTIGMVHNHSRTPLFADELESNTTAFVVDIERVKDTCTIDSSESPESSFYNRADDLEPNASSNHLLHSHTIHSMKRDKEKSGGSADSDCAFLRKVTAPRDALAKLCARHRAVLKKILLIFIAIGMTAYMCLAVHRDFHRALPLLIIWSLVVVFSVYGRVARRWGADISRRFAPLANALDNHSAVVKWLFVILIVCGFVAWIVIDTRKRPEQLLSGLGYFVFIFLLFITSKYPNRVRWRPVAWGCLIQFCLAMLVLRTQFGFHMFHWVGNLVQTFINYTDTGASFVFGAKFTDHFFAFKVLPIVIYFSAFISVLYYLGAMQWLILKIAWLMQISLNTSPTESMVAAGNIFVGQTEAPLLIRPYIDDLTTSELHAVMTAGFGTVSGSVLGAYLGFGIEPVYLITACVMAAPCALGVSKLVYPETKSSKFMARGGLELDKTEQRNVVEAAFVGASQAIPLVLNIGANLIAFLALLAALNGFLGWFGSLLDFPALSFELICSYLFMPVAFLMGIDFGDCYKAAELIGTKVFLNEFIAYEKLSLLIAARDNGTIAHFDPATGHLNWIGERTEAIVTYALCGFANVGSLGIMLGGLGTMAPKRQGEMAGIVLRALSAGIFVSILNACVAGFLYVPRPIVCTNILATNNWNNTEADRLFECCSTVVLPGMNGSSVAAANCCNHTWPASYMLANCPAAL